MFSFITITGQTWQGHNAQPQTPCAKPAVRTAVEKGNEDTLPT
jgi:hypothetical protein